MTKTDDERSLVPNWWNSRGRARLASAIKDAFVPLIRFWSGQPDAEGAETDTEAEFRFLVGPIRQGIRRSPEIVVFTTIVLFVVAELAGGGAYGASVLLQSTHLDVPVTDSGVPFLGFVALWSVVLLSIVWLAGVVRLLTLLKGLVMGGIAAGLAIGTVVSAGLVLSSDNPTQLQPSIVYVSGYLLTLLVGGGYIWSGIRYTEEMLNNLGPKIAVTDGQTSDSTDVEPEDGDPMDVASGEESASEAYDAFVRDLNEALRARLGPVRAAHAFAFVVVLPFAVVWGLENGPQNIGSPWTSLVAFLVYVMNLAFDFVIAVVAFQFLVLLRYLYDLITRSYALAEGQMLELEYRPQYPDGCAGLSDLGIFAMKVNVLLILGAVFLLYRLYVQGLRVLPPDTIIEQAETVPYNWLFSYVSPVFIFTAVMGAWLFYTLWQLHRKMARDRRAILRQWDDIDDRQETHIVADDIDWRDAQEAPVWPIENRQVIPLAIANVAPVVVVLIEAVQLL